MDTANPARKLTLAQKRDAWLTEVYEAVNADPDNTEVWTTTIERVLSEGPAMGRSEKWQAAVRWFEDMRKDENSWADDRWIATQGSVYLAHAL
jgi:hypothetical protein